jgi:hypothetical protein
MADVPPRRSRRPSDTRKDATFPLIPFLIGVVILGFVIGAGLSMAGRHGSSPQVATAPVATDEPTATPAPTLAPLATARPVVPATAFARDETASPEPSALASPTAKPKPKPSVTHVALASPLPSAAPSVAPSIEVSAAVTPTPAAVRAHHATTVDATKTVAPPAVTKKPTATSVPDAAPNASVAPASTTAAPPTAAQPGAIEADSDFGRLSANVVRQYLRALARGDTQSAAGAFPPGTPNLTFPEQPILDASATIGTISARGSSQTQTVNAAISTANGNYTGTYTVQRTATGAAVIVSHSLYKG